jgi:sugar transferase (PEP-CTERM/EpsH1 system associated)
MPGAAVDKRVEILNPRIDLVLGGPIRIMHVVNVLSLAGMEYGVIKLVNRLDPVRFAPKICCLAFQREVTKPVLDARIPVFELKKRPGRDWGMVLRLAALFRREQVDIVHSHNWQTFFYAVAAAALAGFPLVIHGEHGRESQGVPRRQRIISAFLARRVSCLVTVSAALGRELVDQWKVAPERVLTIPNGVDLEAFGKGEGVDALRREFHLEPGDRVILNIGGLRPVKDHPTLLRAFARVRRAFPDARLLLAGSDFGKGLQGDLEKLAEDLGIRNAVSFAGIRHDVPRLLSLCDVYVNASVFEGMSNTILEAMASRKPVVATAVGGNPELVRDGETGFLFPPGDDRQLAERLEQVLAEPALARALGDAGRAFVEREHPMSGMVQRYGDLYRQVVVRHRIKRMSSHRSRVKRAAANALRWSGLNRIKAMIEPSSLRVLTYHRVLPLAESLQYPFQGMMMAQDLFEAQMAYLVRHYTVLDLNEAIRLLQEGRLPRRAVTVTFDDGYGDNFDYAWPILKKYRIPATFFLVTGVLDRTVRLWWDEVARDIRRLGEKSDFRGGHPEDLPSWMVPLLADLRRGGDCRRIAQRVVHRLNNLPRQERLESVDALRARVQVTTGDQPEPMLTWEQVREMHRSGMQVGAHTVSHAFIDELDDAGAEMEIQGSVDRIQEQLHVPTRVFSFPRGRFRAGLEAIFQKAGIAAAVTTEIGRNAAGCDPMTLKRMDAGLLSPVSGFSPAVLESELLGWFNLVRRG